jgi:hypothetical protein
MAQTAKRGASNQRNPGVPLLLGLILLGASYGFASWAIDNGRISVYVLTFISFFLAIKYLVRGVKALITK